MAQFEVLVSFSLAVRDGAHFRGGSQCQPVMGKVRGKLALSSPTAIFRIRGPVLCQVASLHWVLLSWNLLVISRITRAPMQRQFCHLVTSLIFFLLLPVPVLTVCFFGADLEGNKSCVLHGHGRSLQNKADEIDDQACGWTSLRRNAI